MSLDIDLYQNLTHTCQKCGTTINCDNTAYEWSANITHNLTRLADKVGLYRPLWRPDECGISKAAQLIQPLQVGIKKLKGDPSRYRQYESPNGWGTYDDFLPWLEKLLVECEQHPDAAVSVSR